MTDHRSTNGLSAITFITTDMAAACAFWSAAGLAIAYGGPDSRFTSFAAGGGTYVNLSAEESDRAGYAPHAMPADAPWGERYFHVTDPDGNEISFARPLSSSD